jgi:hypothetical protein
MVDESPRRLSEMNRGDPQTGNLVGTVDSYELFLTNITMNTKARASKECAVHKEAMVGTIGGWRAYRAGGHMIMSQLSNAYHITSHRRRMKNNARHQSDAIDHCRC